MGGAAAPLNDGTARFRTQVQLVDCRAMFNLSGSEIVFLLLIALIVLGPEALPDAVRKFGKVYGELKKMSGGFQCELKSALDEPMREMRATADAFKKAANLDFDSLNTPEVTEPAATEPAVTEPAVAEPTVAEPAVTESEVAESAVTESEVAESAVAEAEVAEPEAASLNGAEPAVDDAPVVRPPGPNFASAAPQNPSTPQTAPPPEVVESVEEPAAE